LLISGEVAIGDLGIKKQCSRAADATLEDTGAVPAGNYSRNLVATIASNKTQGGVVQGIVGSILGMDEGF
jgi:hypothetical protein